MMEADPLRDLEWVMRSPSLVLDHLGEFSTVTDTECAQLSAAGYGRFSELLHRPGPLIDFLAAHPRSGRLGNYFESLILFWLRELVKVPRIEQGIPVRVPGGKTLGELDFLWEPQGSARVQHWEAAVKFYMCIASSPQEALRADSFVGQALLDRLDLKIQHSLEQQLPLARNAITREVLQARGWPESVESRLFMKGRLFYPLEWSWREVVGPREVSPRHLRGWWLAWDSGVALQKLIAWSAANERVEERALRRWLVLPKNRWLGPAISEEACTDDEVASRLDVHFLKTSNAVQLARVERSGAGPWVECDQQRGVGRGMVLMPGWPASASEG